MFPLIQGLRTDVFLLIQGLRTDLACYLISVLVALLHRRYTCQLLYVIARTRPRKSRKVSPASRVAEVLLLWGWSPSRSSCCLSTVGIWALDWLAWLNLTRRSTEPGSMLPSRFKGGWHFLHAKYPRHFFGWSRFSVSMLGCWDALVSISPQLVHARSLSRNLAILSGRPGIATRRGTRSGTRTRPRRGAISAFLVRCTGAYWIVENPRM